MRHRYPYRPLCSEGDDDEDEEDHDAEDDDDDDDDDDDEDKDDDDDDDDDEEDKSTLRFFAGLSVSTTKKRILESEKQYIQLTDGEITGKVRVTMGTIFTSGKLG